jgi:glycosyltransferase involved in cell wall biosynthesis
MMRVVALTVGNSQAGSTRFRVMQYAPYLSSKGVDLKIIPQNEWSASALEEIRNADVVINQKCLLKSRLAKQIIDASRFLVFDFDDAIYTRPGKPYGWLTQWRVNARFNNWLKGADVVTVANEQLARSAKGVAKQVEILPMGIDVSCWQPKVRGGKDVFCVGWVGAPNNLVYLERLDSVFVELFRLLPHMRLRVFCGQKPNLSVPFDYVPFVSGGEVAFIQDLDVGLLPMEDDEYSRGKSPIKAIQYLACGVPVVGNFVGAANEICLTNNSIKVSAQVSWEEAIMQLTDISLRQQLGMAGRQHVQAHNDASALCQRLYSLFK